MSRLKIVIVAVILVVVAAVLVLWPRSDYSSGRIISTSFAGYDFARAVTGSSDDVRMLLKPGADMHDYEPTPQDIIDIQKSQLFIYIGGESEEWVERLLKDNEISSDKTLRLMDFVELKNEEIKEGMQVEEEGEDEEDDEHIWTSPKNAIRLVNAIRDKLTSINYGDAGKLDEHAKAYTNRLSEIDQKLSDIIAKAARKELIFGDRFPFRYFVDEYKLNYYAAFPGCAEQTEASSQTLAFLIKKVRETGAKAIFKIELSSGKLAETIAEATGAKVYTLNAAHNISESDFNSGKTYADIMTENAKVLEEALN